MTNPVKSKTNWIAVIVVIMGFLTDPAIIGVIPPDWAPFILKVAGAVTFIISAFFTKRVTDTVSIPGA